METKAEQKRTNSEAQTDARGSSADGDSGGKNQEGNWSEGLKMPEAPDESTVRGEYGNYDGGGNKGGEAEGGGKKDNWSKELKMPEAPESKAVEQEYATYDGGEKTGKEKAETGKREDWGHSLRMPEAQREGLKTDDRFSGEPRASNAEGNAEAKADDWSASLSLPKNERDAVRDELKAPAPSTLEGSLTLPEAQSEPAQEDVKAIDPMKLDRSEASSTENERQQQSKGNEAREKEHSEEGAPGDATLDNSVQDQKFSSSLKDAEEGREREKLYEKLADLKPLDPTPVPDQLLAETVVRATPTDAGCTNGPLDTPEGLFFAGVVAGHMTVKAAEKVGHMASNAAEKGVSYVKGLFTSEETSNDKEPDERSRNS